MATVGVIIPAFNAAQYLPAAIESVIAQTFHDWQIILVDDGSTDNTADVVAPYLQQLGPKLLYIKQPNGGLPAARNTAIRNSSAEFLALLDADDVWLPCRLAESMKSFEGRPQVGLSYGFNARIDQQGQLLETFARKQKHGEGRVAPYIYMRKIDLPCPTVTFRKAAVDKVGLFDESMRATEDRDLWLRIAQEYEVALVPKVIAHYRTSPGSMSSDPNRMLNAQRLFIKKHYGSPGCGIIPRQIAWARAYKQRAEAFKAQKRSFRALRSSLHAMAIYPLDVDNFRTTGSLFLNWLGSWGRS